MKKGNWLYNVDLIGDEVSLIPMMQNHERGLSEAVDDGELWKLWYTNIPKPDSMGGYITKLIKEKENGYALPFVVIHNATNKIIGSTRLCNADSENFRVEIGYTWYAKSFQRTAVNTECKLLLLSHAFEQLNAIAVEFRTSWHNQPSRKAIERLGAKQDGIIRNHRKLPDGSYRDTVIFSIIDSEWLAVKTGLQFRLNNTYERFENLG